VDAELNTEERLDIIAAIMLAISRPEKKSEKNCETPGELRMEKGKKFIEIFRIVRFAKF
jgi:hypothetical protein